MLKQLISLIRVVYSLVTLIKVKEVSESKLTLSINGSTISFTRGGDIEVNAARNLITTYQYSFQNCSPEFIEEILTQAEEESPASNVIYLDAYRRAECLELPA